MHKKYTSDSVNVEIGYFKDFTVQLGRQLAGALKKGKRKDVIHYPRTIFIGYGDSRWELIDKVIGLIKNRDAEGMDSEYRAFKKLVWTRIDDAIAKTNKPFEKQSTDKKFIDSLAYINDIDDQHIIADAAKWAANYSFAIFCTEDREHILNNEASLTKDVALYLKKNSLFFKHVKDM